MSIDKKQLVTDLISAYGKLISRKDVYAFAENKGIGVPYWLLNNPDYRSGRGLIDLELFGVDVAKNVNKNTEVEENLAPALQAAVLPLRQKKLVMEIDNLVPVKDETYVPFGFYRDLEQILKSKVFYPVFITGLTGNGKTTMVEQVCSKLKLDCIRVNVSIETDEDDLKIGRAHV